MALPEPPPYDPDPAAHGPWTEYLWIVVVGAVVAFVYAMAIGSNDVANAFGTCVGSKTLSLRQACMLAVVVEMSGALALGSSVTETIAQAVADPEEFRAFPEMYMYGMLCSTAAAAVWVSLSTYLELAVSSTHAIIGALIGFALVWKGKDGVHWASSVDHFPFTAGLSAVLVSWAAAPLLAGALASALYCTLRTLILRSSNSVVRAFWALPLLVLLSIFVGLFMVLLRGGGKNLDWSAGRCAWVSAAAALGCAALTAVIAVPLLMRRFDSFIKESKHHHQAPTTHVAFHPSTATTVTMTSAATVTTITTLPSSSDGPGGAKTSTSTTATGLWDTVLTRSSGGNKHSASTLKQAVQSQVESLGMTVKGGLLYGLNQDVQDLEGSQQLVSMHQAAEIFEPETEHVFKYLQVFSACFVAFAHGANDVANAVGPFSSIWFVYNNLEVPIDDLTIPRWILAMGGLGMALGLLSFGYRIIRALGVKMIKVTPSRGFCAEISTALTVVVASSFGMPVSTTHCIVGAEAALGMCEDLLTGTNWALVAKTFTSWVFTVLVTIALSAALFAQGAYAPSIVMAHELDQYEAGLATIARAYWTDIGAANAATPGMRNASLAAMVARQIGEVQLACNAYQVFPQECLLYFEAAAAALRSSSVLVVGYDAARADFSAAQVTIPVQGGG